jgi:hypothetical protein
MFASMRRFFRQFFSRSRTINNEPLNRVSLIVIILIDIFILVNVFAGLDDISRWYISPAQAYPCYAEWQDYRTQTQPDKDYAILRSALPPNPINPANVRQSYQQAQEDHLGTVNPTCLQYGDAKDQVNNSRNRQTVQSLDQTQEQIAKLEQANATIRSQYDSTLLERIAGQPREQSINQTAAEKAKETLDQNNQKIASLKTEVTNRKNQLLAAPESARFLALLKDGDRFGMVKQGYDRANFWYPSIQLTFQSLFLLPLLFAALTVYRFAQRKGYGLVSLISWHLLIIFLIPLILKVFEFLQVGVLFQFIFDIIRVLFGGFLFLVSYIYILLIPLLGFGIIKFFQRVVLNPNIQASRRVQNSCCIKCARRIRPHDSHCPHCGYYQYVECPNCHEATYKYLSYCKVCGHPQNPRESMRSGPS